MIFARCFSKRASLIQRYLGKGLLCKDTFFFSVGLVTLSLLLEDLRLGSLFSISCTFFDMVAASAQCLAILWRSAVVEEVLNRPKALLFKPRQNAEVNNCKKTFRGK